MVAPIVAAKAAQGAKNALSGDIWTRTTYREVGKGKDKRLVESTVRVNTGSALAGAGALGVLGVGLGVTAFMLGVKAKPVTRTEDWGYWVWPDGTYASRLLPADDKGTAPTRILKEEVKGSIPIETPFYEEECSWNPVTHEWFNCSTVIAGYTVEWIPTIQIKETPQTATWLTTETKDKLGFDVVERPTMAEGLTGAITELVSVPFDIAFAPLDFVNNTASDTIQDLKDKLGLP